MKSSNQFVFMTGPPTHTTNATMLEFSNLVISLFQQMVATEQDGLLRGKSKDPANPLRLWIIQAGIITCTASFLSLGLRKIHQPKVIAEVLAGIILGPTAFGQIPGFTEHIFPLASRSYLSLVANIGLCLFLFLVGLEIDAEVIKRNARLSTTVALAGMVLPFGIGAGMAHAVYKEFINPEIAFTHFMLFTGVAYSITAFPVLCRILTELKLLDTTVGIVVLSAGVGNDIVGWILLALSVALVNASNGLTAFYILFACLGWTLFLTFPGKMALHWLARRTGSIESGPTVFFMTVTMLITFGSAFITDVIGVHPIFGAFIAGLIVPREGGLAILITEKLEDIVSIIFLPLYFTLSGLSTDLGLLNDGITWLYTIAIITTSFAGKFGGCALAAHYFAGFNWRESSAIGSLMSCKGLVELIVLNVGLSAGILSQRVFSMFVLESLVLTFITTPLVTYFYPPHLRHRIAASGANFGNIADEEGAFHKAHGPLQDGEFKTRFTVVLDKLEHVPGMMALTQLIQPAPPPILSRESNSSSAHGPRAPSWQSINHTLGISLGVLRLLELSDRVSDVMKSSVSDSLPLTDPLLSIFHMFGQLNGMHVTPILSTVKFEDLAYRVAEHARTYGSDMIMLPWLPPVRDTFDGPPPSTQGPIALPTKGGAAAKTPHHSNPFDMLFRSGGTPGTIDVSNSVSVIHSQFVRGVFSQATTDVALFVDQNTLDSASIVGGMQQQHVFLPFFGGPDDRLALEFMVQICANPRMRGTVVRITKCDVGDIAVLPTHVNSLCHDEGQNMEENTSTVGSGINGMSDVVYGQRCTDTRMQSEVADNIIWARHAKFNSDRKSTHSTTSSFARPQIEFKSLSTPIPLHAAIQEATSVIYPMTTTTKLIVVTGRSRRLAVENHRRELKELMKEHEYVGEEVRRTIGDVGTAFVVAGVGSGVVVLQAAGVGNLD